MTYYWHKELWDESYTLLEKCHTLHDWYFNVTFLIEPSEKGFIECINIMNSKGYNFKKVMWPDDIPSEIKLFFDFARVGVQIKDSVSSVPFFIYFLTSKDEKKNAYVMRGITDKNPVDVAEVIVDVASGEILSKECYV